MVGGTDFGETDRIVRFLTPSSGRVSAIAKRARTDRKRFRGALDVGSLVEAKLRAGRSSLWVLESATLLNGREGVRADLERIALLAYACDICGSLAREGEPEPRLYGLLETAALLLDAMTGTPSLAFRVGLEAKALTFAGLRPTLSECIHCDEPLDDSVRFHASGGGAAHARCEHLGETATLPWLSAVESARRTPLRQLIDVSLPAGPRWALADAITAHIGRPLKSQSVLHALLIDDHSDTGRS